MHTTLGPVVVLVLWSLVMLGWTVVRRFVAMKANRISIAGRRGGRGQDLEKMLPDAAVHWPSHNYTHLMEQPTLFYAIALALFAIGAGGGWSAWLAWAYVAIRVVHSVVQSTSNIISIRANLFLLSTAVLIALAVRAMMALPR